MVACGREEYCQVSCCETASGTAGEQTIRGYTSCGWDQLERGGSSNRELNITAPTASATAELIEVLATAALNKE